MPEKINIGSFDFEADSVIRSMGEIRGEMTSTQEEIKRLRKENRDLEKSLEGLEKGTAEYDAQLEKNNKTIKRNNEELVLNENTLKKQREEYKQFSKVLDSVTTAEGEITDAQDKAREALNRSIGTINEARDSNKELLAVRNELNVNIPEEAALLEQLNNRLDENNAFIKENASAYEQQKINIGNYKQDIKEALSETDAFNGTLNIFIKIAKQSATSAGGVGGMFKSMAGGIVSATKASLAFLATPLGLAIAAIGVVVGALVKYLKSTQEGMDAVTAVTRPLSAVMSALVGVLQDVVKFIVAAFTEPQKHMKAVYDYVKDKVIRIFEGLYSVIKGIVTFDWDGVKEGLETVGQVAVDVTNDIGAAGAAMGERFAEAINAGREIDRLQKQIERNEIDIIGLRQQTNSRMKELQVIARDTAKSAEERRAAVEEQEQITRRLIDAENEILDAQIKQLEIQHSLNDTSREDEKELAELRAKRAEQEDKMTDVERQNIRIINSINNEAEANRKAAIQERQRLADAAYSAEQKRMTENLNLFKANQGFRKKSLEEEFELEQKIAEDRLKILQHQLRNRRITQAQFDAERLQIEADLGRRTAEIAAQNAADELEAWQRANEGILADGKRLSEEQVATEQQRIDTEEEMRESEAAKRLELGLITEREYQQAVLEIQDEAQAQRLALNERFQQQLAAQEILARQTAFEAEILQLQEQGATRWEIESAQLDFEMQSRLDRLNDEREQNLITEEEYQAQLTNIQQEWNLKRADFEKTLAETVAAAKAQIASKAFGVMADMMGKESAAGKAAAVAQTTIDTYQAAQAIYKSMAPFGPIVAAISAATAVASGLLNVRKILTVKTPKTPSAPRGFATGGVVTDGFPIQRDNGDDVLITAQRGEVILNQRQQAMAGGAPFFAALGVPGADTLPTPAGGGIDYNQMAEAVMRGAMLGSNKGIRDLNSDFEIRNSAVI